MPKQIADAATQSQEPFAGLLLGMAHRLEVLLDRESEESSRDQILRLAFDQRLRPRTEPVEPDILKFHQSLWRWRLTDLQTGRLPSVEEVSAEIQRLKKSLFPIPGAALEIIRIGPSEWPLFANRIDELQTNVYEPARRTSRATFERVVNDPRGVLLVVTSGRRLIGLAALADLRRFETERGVTDDPYFKAGDSDTAYIVDVTVDPREQTAGLGKFLKLAISAWATQSGWRRLKGRNRSQLARAMVAINLSLGANEERRLHNDYPDELADRDAIYYSQPLRWSEVAADTKAPYGISTHDLTAEIIETLAELYMGENPDLTFAAKKIGSVLPDALRVVELVSSKRAAVKKVEEVLRFETLIPLRLGQPLADVERIIRSNSSAAVWIEPMENGGRWEIKDLRAISAFCAENRIQLVFDETQSQSYRYSRESFFASQGIAVDALVVQIGRGTTLIAHSGQAGHSERKWPANIDWCAGAAMVRYQAVCAGPISRRNA